jgi:hypothetical protein
MCPPGGYFGLKVFNRKGLSILKYRGYRCKVLILCATSCKVFRIKDLAAGMLWKTAHSWAERFVFCWVERVQG